MGMERSSVSGGVRLVAASMIGGLRTRSWSCKTVRTLERQRRRTTTARVAATSEFGAAEAHRRDNLSVTGHKALRETYQPCLFVTPFGTEPLLVNTESKT